MYCWDPDSLLTLQVSVLGPPRGACLAHAKYSHWVLEREKLEEMRPQGAAEVGQ